VTFQADEIRVAARGVHVVAAFGEKRETVSRARSEWGLV
jgi:hypothetical protein